MAKAVEASLTAITAVMARMPPPMRIPRIAVSVRGQACIDIYAGGWNPPAQQADT
jgi:hypothetical protein